MTSSKQRVVALVVQGEVIDARAVDVGTDQADLSARADREAERLNSELQGESLGWSALVIPLEEARQ
jgi:hypothetical protein